MDRSVACMPFSTTIDQRVTQAIARRIFPGAVVLVTQASELRHFSAYGSTMYDDPASLPVTRDTIYDIASLTKVFTATAALRLVDQGLLELDAPVAAYLPELRASGVRVIHLLTHTSGLDLRLSTLRHHGRDGLLAAVYDAALLHPPGTVVAYTNLNSLLLGELVARLRGQPLEAALAALVLDPLGLRETRFCPPADWLPRIAPTEHDSDWRGGLVHGSVHDESTHALGGVAGHAGLFSTAADLRVFCEAWLRALASEQSLAGLLRPELARAATTNCTPGLQFACGLGWMIDRANFMGAAPTGSFGHTGFTGPAMVVVPSQRLVVIVLSNRVYPRRQPPPYAHHAVTAAIVNAALFT